MELIFATQNPNKIKEVAEKLHAGIQVKSLLDMGFNEELEETSNTLEGNALQKARKVFELFGKNCFADDTGLEVKALNNTPGVYSARYAGEAKSADANMDKVLKELEGKEDRRASFSTIIALIHEGKEYVFEGRVDGEILHEKRGGAGFGYDPIFKPEDSDKSFAEMNMHEKGLISHRGKAVEKLVEYLNGLI